MAPFAPQRLGITVARTTILNMSPIVQRYIKAMESEDRRDAGEDVALVPRPTPDDVNRAVAKAAYAAVREVAVKVRALRGARARARH